MLQGFGGIGKTVLAAQIATDWLKENGGRVLWLPFGSASEDAAFEALAQPFNMSKEMASAEGKGKGRLLNELLQAADVRLLVLDDVWNGASLYAILNELSKKISVLVTGRQRYALKKIIPVPELSPAAALKLLRELAEDFSKDKKESAGLCADLGHLAFAIVIAGRTMQAKSYTAKQLREEITRIGKTNLEVPQDFREAGRETVAALIETSLEAMPYNAKMTFWVWGAFWSSQITPELIMRYFLGKPEVTDEMMRSIRAQNPQLPANLPDEQLKQLIEQALTKDIDSKAAEDALNLLMQYGFASPNPATSYPDGRPRTVATYRLYDLAFSYSEKGASHEMREKALSTCLLYTNAHNEPSLGNFAALVPEIDNFLGASKFAMRYSHYKEVERFAWDLYTNSRVLDYQGLQSFAIIFLEKAAQAAEKSGNKYNQSAHLGNLGIAYRNLGQYQQAIGFYQQALTIAEEIGDKDGKGTVLSNLGNAYIDLGQLQHAIDHFQQALAIAQEVGDIHSKGTVLGNLGLAYRNLGQYQQAIGFYQQALAIAQEIGDVRGKGIWLGNLGLASADLGQYQQAIDHFQQALAIAEEIGDRGNKGNNLGNLGVVYRNLGDYQQAIVYHRQALAIAQEIEDKRGEGNQLGYLGVAYRNLGDYQQAVDHYLKALAIAEEIGDKSNKGNSLGNLGNIYYLLGKNEEAINYHRQALAIQREIGDKRGEGSVLGNLGVAYGNLGQHEQAIVYYQQALNIFRELGNPHSIEQAEHNLSRAQQRLAEQQQGGKQDA